MPSHQLAQLNVAVMKAPLDSPLMADFVAGLDRINALAEGSPGFVWRLQTEEGNATALRPMGDDVIVNMSVWQDIETLQRFVFRSAHVEVMRRRKEWFERMSDAFGVLWWLPAGQRPTMSEAAARLEQLRRHGATPQAFTFRLAFPPPDAGEAATPFGFGGECPAT